MGLVAGCKGENLPECIEANQVFQAAVARSSAPGFKDPDFDRVLALVVKIEDAGGVQCDQARSAARQIKVGRMVAAETEAKLSAQRKSDAAEALRTCKSSCGNARRECESGCRCTRSRSEYCRPGGRRRCRESCAGAIASCKSDCDAFAKAPEKRKTVAAPKEVLPQDKEPIDVGRKRINLGDAPCKQGAVEVQNLRIEQPKAHATFNVGRLYEGFLAMTWEERVEREILACDGGRASKIEDRYQWQRRRTNVEGEDHVIVGPFHGQIVVAEWQKKKKGYERTLFERKPTTAQENALAAPVRLGGDLYPNKRVAVGHRWKLDDDQLRAWAGVHPEANFEGTGSMHFEKVVPCGDDECAVIRARIRFDASHKRSASVYDMSGFILRNLSTMRDDRVELSGKMESAEYVEDGRSSGRIKTEGDATYLSELK